MTLKDLQEMIKEELDAYMNEEEVSEENTQEAMDVDVDADDVDADGDMEGDTSEDMLRQIYMMLKDKFEDMDDMDGEDMDDMDEDDMMESPEETVEEAKDEDLEEGKEADEDMKEEVSAETTHLQERFKKLANIIK